MISDRRDFADRLSKRLAKEATDAALNIGRGKTALDINTYNREVGRVLGMEHALSLIEDIDREMNQEQSIR